MIVEVVAHTFGIIEFLDCFQESNVIQFRSNDISKGLIFLNIYLILNIFKGIEC